jgi:hypothetical protein
MKAILNFPGYYITKKGIIYSYRNNKGGIGKIKRVIEGYLNSKGYKRVILYQNSKRFQFQISRLVAITYIPNPQNLPVVMHIDNNPLNNYYRNLKWGTQSENITQCSKEGRIKGNTKITPEQKQEIIKLYSTGNYTQLEISNKIGLSKMTIRRALKCHQD